MESREIKISDRFQQLLIEADSLAAESKYFEAVLSCNKALCCAKSKSSIALVFARRSSIYFKLKEYQKCLDDIEAARQTDCEAKDVSKNIERETVCENKIATLESSSDPWDFFKLSYDCNEKIPHIIDCLKPQNTLKYGRCVITSKNLNPGDVVAIEEPFLRMLCKNARFKRCAYCLKSNKMCLLPCPGKCSSTMFCSPSCLETALRTFHKLECNSLDQYIEDDNEYDMTVLKIVFESLSMCGGSILELQSLLNGIKANSTVFNFDLSLEAKEATRCNMLKSVLSLSQGPASDEDREMAAWIVDTHPYLTSICKAPGQRDFLKHFVVKIMGILDRNSYILFCSSLRNPSEKEETGSGVFPFASLLNHSCSPNLYRVFVDNKQVFIANKPITAGSQLFVGYHAGFLLSPKEERQKFLLDGFQFKCTCEACTAEYPTMQKLVKYDTNFQLPLSADNVTQAKEIFRDNCRYLTENVGKFHFPSFEICCVMQSSLKQLLFIAGQMFLVGNFCTEI